MATPENKLPLKVMVDSKRNKVMFAEAGSDFVDVLLSFLTLPLGTIIRRLNQHFGENTEAIGCFSNLYSSVENLSDSDFMYKEFRQMLLQPKNVSHSDWLKLKVDDSKLTQYYKCGNQYCCNQLTFSINNKAKCHCGVFMNVPFYIFTSSDGRVFTDSRKTFIITDDLRVMPSLDGLNFELIQNLAVDVEKFEEQTIDVGLNEIMHLLKWSLVSPTPLTNMLLWPLKSPIIKQEPNFGTMAPKGDTAVKTNDSEKMVIKVLVQKSTNKLLFFLVGVDFVGFLFRLLTIPLGSVVSFLGGNCCLPSIDNLYTSVSKLSSQYLVSQKDPLVNPKIVCNVVFKGKPGTPGLELMDLMGDDNFFECKSTFMVTDELIVTPLTSMSILLHLQSRKIPVSDVKEIAFDIGKKEALYILETSLTNSTSALSNAL